MTRKQKTITVDFEGGAVSADDMLKQLSREGVGCKVIIVDTMVHSVTVQMPDQPMREYTIHKPLDILEGVSEALYMLENARPDIKVVQL